VCTNFWELKLLKNDYNRHTVSGLNLAHGLWCTGEASPRAVARRPTTQPSSNPARPARARHGAHALPVVTARWPHARQRASAAGGVPTGDEVRENWQGQLTQEAGEVLSKASGGGAHPNSGASVERWGSAARWHSVVVELAQWSPTMRP
jgi:hypothetical protein